MDDRFRAAKNVTDAPVLIDGAGRTLGGGEWGPVDTASPEVKAAVADDRLVVPPAAGDLPDPGDDGHPDTSGVDPAFRRAHRAAGRATGHVEALAALDPEALEAAAAANGIHTERPGRGGRRSRGQLIGLLAALGDDLELPDPSTPAALTTPADEVTDDQLAALSVGAVVQFVDANPDQRDRVLTLEHARPRPRTGVLTHLEA